ncbi:MAG: hypothetical protein BGO12_11685 [Verrucomicrobia bacterium 61-8]|nr:hypothetical protein [Verrucomicrobiota bacterium]OJV01274.1 MAG: hypothetical protein BGO12_11685 [Verrucomicrobia bacterium 61-8]
MRPRFSLEWQVGRHARQDDPPAEWLAARVPGAAQLDWARHHGWPHHWQADHFRAYDGLEDSFWTYRARIPALPEGRVFLICRGVDYRFVIRAGDRILHEQEGMFTPVELDLTGQAVAGEELFVTIFPAPKSRAVPADRSQADHSCKPAVSYGWDFHPRLISQGLWDDAWLEVRGRAHFTRSATDYSLPTDLQTARLEWKGAAAGECASLRWRVFAPDGALLAERMAAGSGNISLSADVRNPALWWPHDHGTPALHVSRVELLDEGGAVLDAREERIGFRRIRLVMAPGQWDSPAAFPKSRSHPPMTLEVNGRRIFVKGANWVSPEIFPGLLNRETYQEQLAQVRAAHMNLLRMWGGSPAQKEAFYNLCDELGIMVWQEFPLACNTYPDDAAYLRVLDQESRSLIARLRPHPSVVLWCGGNELFNSWSRMTDQSLALRLLAANCYQLDPARPFLPTSPVDGVGHGHYAFRDMDAGEEAWAVFQRSASTAYCEFGCPGPASEEVLREIIPAEELFPPRPGGIWQAHHGFGVWKPSSWLHLDVIAHYWAEPRSLEELVARGQLLQAEGGKGLVEEARRQKPAASMAVYWCLNEPWPAVANNSLISWPCRPKPALAAVGAACRPILASARIRKFQWRKGDSFEAEIWWLNDGWEGCDPGRIEVRIALAGETRDLLSWKAGRLEANCNLAGPTVRWVLPEVDCDHFELILDTPGLPGAASRYTLLLRDGEAGPDEGATPTMNLG